MRFALFGPRTRRVTAGVAMTAAMCLSVPPASSLPRSPSAGPPAIASAPAGSDDHDTAWAAAFGVETVEVIVSFDELTAAADGADRLRAAAPGLVMGRELRWSNAVVVELPADRIGALAAAPGVARVDPNLPIRAANDSANAGIGSTTARASFAVDGDGDGSPTSYSANDAVAAVVDTGIDASHPDLDGGKVLAFYDAVGATVGCPAPPAGPYDDDVEGHGTHVAATLAGSGDGGASRTGIAPAGALVGVKVLDCVGSGSSAALVDGIDWVIAHRATYGIAVINLSVEGSVCSSGDDPTSLAVDRAFAAGILVVVAAGNLNGAATACGFTVPGSVTFPGTAREALTVGAAADPQSGGWNVASFSGRGPTIDGRIKPDVVAPGINVTSAKVGGGYTSKSGTSMATPVVSGLALLLHDAQPASTADQLRSTIIGSAVNWQNLTVPNNTYGTGHVDANAALALITAEPPTVTPTLVFSYGKVDDIVLIGDWDGNQSDTPAVRRGNTYYLNNSNAGGNADRVIGYGRASDEVFVGDWDGDGIDTFAVRRGNRFFVRNSTTSGPADIVFGYGRAGDEVLVGDWDVDGVDTFAVRRGNVIHVRNDFVSGPAQNTFGYGKASDQLLVGDWDGDGVDTFGVRRGRAFHLRNSNTSGPADFAATLGNVSDTPVVGDFDADGIDEFGVRSGKVISIVL